MRIISQWPLPGTTWDSSEPKIDVAMPIGAAHKTTCQSTRCSRTYRAVPDAALGRIDGSVVPTATNAEAPRARMAGVEIVAPPTPNAADMTPVITPAATVRTSRRRPGCRG